MKKTVYISGLVIIILIISIYFYRSNAHDAYVSPEVPVVEKRMTRMDSVIFQYDSLFSGIVDSTGSVGAAIAVTYKGEIALLKCYGVKKWGENDSIDKNTIFRLASVSKTITGVLAGILSEENIIPLDDKVIDYLPGFQLKDSVNTFDLSIRNILSHTSGLVPHAYDNLVEAQVPMHTIIDSLKRVNISDVPGKLYGYQNVIFSLYDTISVIASGKSFSQLLDEKVFIPFGMAHASAGFDPFVKNENKAFPHQRSKGNYRILKLNNRYYNTNPAAGINASISDMAQFLLALTDTTVIKNSTLNEIFKPLVVTPLKWQYLRKWGKVESRHYALGWRIIGYQCRQIAYHGGYVQGYRAEIAVCREEELGIVFLSNSPNGTASLSIPMFLDLFLTE